MRKYTWRKIDYPETTDKICDRCGRSCSAEAKDENGNHDIGHFIEWQEFTRINFAGGYGSVFGDGTEVDVDICQHCLFELIKDFYRVKDYHV